MEEDFYTKKHKDGMDKQADPDNTNKLAGKIDEAGLQRESNEIEYINIYWDEWRE